MSKRSTSVTIIAILAIAQAVFGVLRAFEWFHIGGDLIGQGLLLLPMVGVVAYARGFLVIVLGLLYLVFASGMLLGRRWAWSLGIVVAIVNILLVVNVMIQGESLWQALVGLIVPLAILWFLIFQARRESVEK
jgi:hypothetical protein